MRNVNLYVVLLIILPFRSKKNTVHPAFNTTLQQGMCFLPLFRLLRSRVQPCFSLHSSISPFPLCHAMAWQLRVFPAQYSTWKNICRYYSDGGTVVVWFGSVLTFSKFNACAHTRIVYLPVGVVKKKPHDHDHSKKTLIFFRHFLSSSSPTQFPFHGHYRSFKLRKCFSFMYLHLILYLLNKQWWKCHNYIFSEDTIFMYSSAHAYLSF